MAKWISLQYHSSSVDPDAFGDGNKLIQNVVGGIGVLQGNGGMPDMNICSMGVKATMLGFFSKKKMTLNEKLLAVASRQVAG